MDDASDEIGWQYGEGKSNSSNNLPCETTPNIIVNSIIYTVMIPNPHKLGVHKLLKHIPLNAIFDAPSKARLRKAVNIADLRLCAKQRAHKVSSIHLLFLVIFSSAAKFRLSLTLSILLPLDTDGVRLS